MSVVLLSFPPSGVVAGIKDSRDFFFFFDGRSCDLTDFLDSSSLLSSSPGSSSGGPDELALTASDVTPVSSLAFSTSGEGLLLLSVFRYLPDSGGGTDSGAAVSSFRIFSHEPILPLSSIEVSNFAACSSFKSSLND